MAAQPGTQLCLPAGLIFLHILPGFQERRDGDADDERLQLEAVPSDQDGDEDTEAVVDRLVFDGHLGK